MTKIFSVRLTDEQYTKLLQLFNATKGTLSTKFKEWLDNIDNIKQLPQNENKNKCIYRSLNPKGYVECAKDFAKKGKIYKVSVEFCNKCWLRRQHVRQNRQKYKVEIIDEDKIRQSPQQTTQKLDNSIIKLDNLDRVKCPLFNKVIQTNECTYCRYSEFQGASLVCTYWQKHKWSGVKNG